MQANCPSCAHRITIDDARAPERAFSVKCPKCQTIVRFPGRTAAGAAAPPPPTPAAAAPAPPPPAAAAPVPPAERADERTESIAQLRREVGGDHTRGATQVLVAVPDRAVAAALTLPLTRLGHTIEFLDTPEEGGRLLEQGVYGIVITTRTAAVPGKGETLFQRVTRLNPESRRRIFMILVGDELKTGDGTQAWVLQADFVANPKDVGTVEAGLLAALAERNRIYQVFLDARRRSEAAAGY